MKLYLTLVWVLNAVELLSCIIGFVYYRKLQSTKWRLLPFYLLLIFVFEMLGRYLATNSSLIRYNPMLFNYVSFPTQFLFFFWIFYREPYFEKVKKIILSAAAIYLLAVVADALYFSEKKYFFHSFSYSIGNVFLLIMLIKYFYELSISEEILGFSYSLMFWFSLGVVVYYIGTLPLWSLRNLLAFKHPDIFFPYAIAGLFMSICMYCLFIVGIIKCKRK
jgi:hypothetical protein